VGLVLLALFSTISPLGHGQTLPSTAVQHDSLLFTVSPDKSVGIGWNTTTFSPVLQNASMIFPPGYVIQSSSSFSQQASSVVETTTVHYQLPQRLNQNLSSIVSSMSFNATQTGLSGQGSLRITTTTLFPVQNINVTYSTSSNRISINATAHAYFSASLYPGTPFESQTAFNNNWTATFGNQAWINNMTYQIQNTTQLLKVDAFYGNVTYSTDNLSASVSITFVGVPSGSEPDFVTAYETLIGLPTPLLTGLDNIIQSALNLSTGQTVKFTYTGSTGTIDFKSTTSYVSDLDAQVNSLKTQFFQLLFGIDPALRAMPSISFLNSTSVTVSKISMTSSLDLYAGTSSTTLNGLIIGPPTVGTNTNFTIPGLFQTLGSVPFSAPGVNITLAGGSDSTNQVKIIVPSGTPAPNSTTSNSATWTNVSNATVLSNVRFVVQPISSSFFALLLSPAGIAIEAIIAAAVIAGILLYARKRRAKMPVPLTPSGPAPAPGLGPSPAPPTQ